MPIDFGQQKNIQELLEKIGLNDHEQRVYLHGITRPPLAVSVLAKQVHLTRSNTYNIIASLQDKGLCWNLGGEYGRKIKFAEPEKLLDLLKQKKKDLTSLEKDVVILTQHLKDQEYTGPITHPRIQYFEGKEAVRKLYSTTLSTKEKLIRTAVSDKLFDKIGEDYVKDYVKSRLSMKIKNKILYTETLENFKQTYDEDPHGNRELRNPPESIIFDSAIIIFDNKVAIVTLANEIFGTLIESVDYSTTMKSWFDTIWDMSSAK